MALLDVTPATRILVTDPSGLILYDTSDEDDAAGRYAMLPEVSAALEAKGYKLLSAQEEMIPQQGYIKLTNEDDIKNMQKMLDMFEDNEDVQNVWHNWEDAE